MGRYASMVGWGKSLPKRVLTNDDLSQMVDTSDEWIHSRTGIRERRVVSDGETACSMSVNASRDALEKAGLDAEDLDLVIVATCSPDYQLPSVANMLQAQLGATHAGAFDLRAGCAGFVYALAVASQFISSGIYRNILVVGAEVISSFINWNDRRTCILFGDGAGAVVLQASDVVTGLLSFVLGSDGSNYDALMVPGGGCAMPLSQKVLDGNLHYLQMDGKRVFRFASRILGEATRQAVRAAHLTLDDVDVLIPHQANDRIVRSACKAMGISYGKAFTNLDQYGNTSAASVPIALCEAMEQERIKKGDNVALVAFGAGLTWAAAVVRMGVPETIPQLVSWQFVPLKNDVWSGIKSLTKTAGLTMAALGAAFLASSSSGLRARVRRRRKKV